MQPEIRGSIRLGAVGVAHIEKAAIDGGFFKVPMLWGRDFRGAMVGRSDKGLFITTGTFTPAAVEEATRDGSPAIDLINGADLADKLKELHLGVSTSVVEVVAVDEGWFETV